MSLDFERSDRDDTASADQRLDALRDHPEWDDRERDEAFEALIAGFESSELVALARRRLGDLSGGDAEAVLRIIEAFGADVDRRALAQAIAAQPDLPPERAWEALSILEGSGLIEDDPALAERWEELAELAGSEGTSIELAAQIEDDPSSLWLALQGLDSIEPALRLEIVAGLAEAPVGPALVEFLRVLISAHDPRIQTVALEVLGSFEIVEASVVEAWSRLAADHRDPAVVALARRKIDEATLPTSKSSVPHVRSRPRVARAVTSPVDGRGRARLAILANDGGEWVSAVFTCDVADGIVGVEGLVTDSPEEAEEFLGEPDEGAAIEAEGGPRLATALLAGSLSLCGPASPTALPYWVERTTGMDLVGHPIGAMLRAGSSDDPTPSQAARDVLDACPDWLDESELTYRLAREAILRGVDPATDAGAARYLFERRLVQRLEPLRRMLLWMAAVWSQGGRNDLARSAALLAGQLLDPQFAVPGHPFLAGLAARSLSHAADRLRGEVESNLPGRLEPG